MREGLGRQGGLCSTQRSRVIRWCGRRVLFCRPGTVSVQTPECRCWPLLSPRVCYLPLIPTGCWRVKNFSLYRESGFVENNLTDFSLLFSPCSIVCKTRVAHGTNSHEVSGSFDCPVSPSPPMPPPFQLTVSLWEPAGVCVPDLTPAAPAPCPAPGCGFVHGLQLLPVPVLSPGAGWVCQGSACPLRAPASHITSQFDLSDFPTFGSSVSIAPWGTCSVPATVPGPSECCSLEMWCPCQLLTDRLVLLNLEGSGGGSGTLLASVWGFLHPLCHSFIPPWAFPAPLSARGRTHRMCTLPRGVETESQRHSTGEIWCRTISRGGLPGVRGAGGQAGTPLGCPCCLWNHTGTLSSGLPSTPTPSSAFHSLTGTARPGGLPVRHRGGCTGP